MLDEEGADGDDARERMQAAPEKGMTLAGTQRLNAFAFFAEIGRCYGSGCGHGEPSSRDTVRQR